MSRVTKFVFSSMLFFSLKATFVIYVCVWLSLIPIHLFVTILAFFYEVW